MSKFSKHFEGNRIISRITGAFEHSPKSAESTEVGHEQDDAGIEDESMNERSVEEEVQAILPVVGELGGVLSSRRNHDYYLQAEIPDVARDATELRGELNSLNQRGSIATEFGKNYLALLKGIAGKLKGVSLENPEECQRITSLLADASTAKAALESELDQLRELDKVAKNTLAELHRSKLQSVGCSTPEQASLRARAVFDELEALQRSFLGLGQLIHRSRIMRLEAQGYDFVRTAENPENSYSISWDHNELSSGFTDVREEIGSEVIKPVVALFERRLAKATDPGRIEEARLDDALVQSLCQAYSESLPATERDRETDPPMLKAPAQFQRMAQWVHATGTFALRQSATDGYTNVWRTIRQAIYSEKNDWHIHQLESLTRPVDDMTDEHALSQSNYLKEVDIGMFLLFINHSEIQKRFDPEEIGAARKELGKALEKTLLGTPSHSEQSIQLGNKLWQLREPATTPITLLNAFRESGYSGEYPYISIHQSASGTALVRRIKELSPEERSAIESDSIPGVADLVRTIERNPESIRDIFWADQTGKSNPDNAVIQQALLKACEHLMDQPDSQSQLFAIDLAKALSGGRADFDIRILKIMKKPVTDALQAVIHRYFNRYDVNQLVPFLEQYDQFDRVVKADFQGYLSTKVQDILRHQTLSPRAIQAFAPFVNLSADQLQRFLSNWPDGVPWPKVDLLTDKFIQRMLARFPERAEMIINFDRIAPHLVAPKRDGLRDFVIQHDVLLETQEDLAFLNTLLARYSKSGDQFIRDYTTCLESGTVNRSEKTLVLELIDALRIVSPTLFAEYRSARAEGTHEIFLAGVRQMMEKMTGSDQVREDERGRPEYGELLRAVYPNNAGNWGSYERTAACQDRSADLAAFKIEPIYEVDLFANADIQLREGTSIDQGAVRQLQEPILSVAEHYRALGGDREALAGEVKQDADRIFSELAGAGVFADLNRESITTTEEQLFLILTESVYGSKNVDSEFLKKVLLSYEFSHFEDIEQYIAGTSDRVQRAGNQDYALLCELNAFFSDRIKEVHRLLTQRAYTNPAIAQFMEGKFKSIAGEGQEAKRARMNVEKIGLAGSFVQQIRRALRGRDGRDYSVEQVQRLIHLYETKAGGLTAKATDSVQPRTRAVYGQLRAQRERTRSALQELTGQDVLPDDVHLDAIDVADLLALNHDASTSTYDQERFAAFTIQKLIDIFSTERELIDQELGKFVSAGGHDRTKLNAYIAKTSETAHARMTGGVCVSADNPTGNPDTPRENIWDMPNYLQLVLQDPETKRCQGLVLLHDYTDQGKRILTASFNPSSTYVYSVDEAALFKGLLGTLEHFADVNGFDAVAVAKNKAIRTNRTGGGFERAIDERIAEVGESIEMVADQPFSYYPEYRQQGLDVLWRRQETTRTNEQ